MIKKITTQTTITTLKSSSLGKLLIPLPPIELQREYALIFSKIQNLKEKQGQSTADIEELSNSLMSKAFKGELVS